jgi:hypothetical protein
VSARVRETAKLWPGGASENGSSVDPVCRHSLNADYPHPPQKDPASIAFAQLAEEYRRAGQLPDAVAACKAGLADKEAILGGNLIKLLRLPA